MVTATKFTFEDIYLYSSDPVGPYPLLAPKSYDLSLLDTTTGVYSTTTVPEFILFDKT